MIWTHQAMTWTHQAMPWIHQAMRGASPQKGAGDPTRAPITSAASTHPPLAGRLPIHAPSCPITHPPAYSRTLLPNHAPSCLFMHPPAYSGTLHQQRPPPSSHPPVLPTRTPLLPIAYLITHPHSLIAYLPPAYGSSTPPPPSRGYPRRAGRRPVPRVCGQPVKESPQRESEREICAARVRPARRGPSAPRSSLPAAAGAGPRLLNARRLSRTAGSVIAARSTSECCLNTE